MTAQSDVRFVQSNVGKGVHVKTRRNVNYLLDCLSEKFVSSVVSHGAANAQWGRQILWMAFQTQQRSTPVILYTSDTPHIEQDMTQYQLNSDRILQ